MEEESIMNKKLLISAGKYLGVSLILALPILGVMHYDDKVLAEVMLGDPVELYKEYPMPMKGISWALLTGLIAAFTPFRSISSLAVGVALGGFLFHGISQYSDLKELSEMGLSKKPLTDLITLTSDGIWLIRMCVICGAIHLLYGIIHPIITFIIKKKPARNKLHTGS